jgi:hypothetical protein
LNRRRSILAIGAALAARGLPAILSRADRVVDSQAAT